MRNARWVEITVRGRLGPRLVAAFDGLSPQRVANGTRLVGCIADQAQLHGLLTRIRDLGLELESVVTEPAGMRGDDPEPDR